MTNKISITKPQAIAALRASVSEMGEDYVYQETVIGCAYTDGNSPSCLVGHALLRLGVPITHLQVIDNTGLLGDTDIGTAYVDYLKPTVGVQMSPKALEAFIEAQRQQDGGRPWGEALEAAKSV